jgi:hypothetical protein
VVAESSRGTEVCEHDPKKRAVAVFAAVAYVLPAIAAGSQGAWAQGVHRDRLAELACKHKLMIAIGR